MPVSGRRRTLTWGERTSVAAGVLLLACARMCLAVRPRCLEAGLSGGASGRRILPRLEASRAGALLGAVAARVPWRPTCLEQACALVWLLRFQGTAARVVIGVARDGGALRAHAWVEHAGTVVLGGSAGGFAPLPPPASVHPCRA